MQEHGISKIVSVKFHKARKRRCCPKRRLPEFGNAVRSRGFFQIKASEPGGAAASPCQFVTTNNARVGHDAFLVGLDESIQTETHSHCWMAASSHQRRSGSVCGRAPGARLAGNCGLTGQILHRRLTPGKSLSPSCAIHFWICCPGQHGFQTQSRPAPVGLQLRIQRDDLHAMFSGGKFFESQRLVRVGIAPRRVIHAPTETGRRNVRGQLQRHAVVAIFQQLRRRVRQRAARRHEHKFIAAWTLVCKKVLPNLSVRTPMSLRPSANGCGSFGAKLRRAGRGRCE